MNLLIINKGIVIEKLEVTLEDNWEQLITSNKYDTAVFDEYLDYLSVGDNYDEALKLKPVQVTPPKKSKVKFSDKVRYFELTMDLGDTFKFNTDNVTYGPSGFCCFVTSGSIKFENENMEPHIQSDKRVMPQDSCTHAGLYTITALEPSTYKCVYLNNRDYFIEILQSGQESTFKDGKYCAAIYGSLEYNGQVTDETILKVKKSDILKSSGEETLLLHIF